MKRYFLIVIFLGGMIFNLQAKTIVFLGDSLTEGYGIEKDLAYPSLIEKKFKAEFKKELKSDLEVHNAGLSGSTSASGLSRLKWFMRVKPDYLFLCLGANDGLRGLKINESKKNFEKIIEFAKNNKIQIFLGGMLMPPNYGKEYTDEFKKMYEGLAQEYNIPLLPFMLEGVAGIKEFNLPDGIHPNEKGHEIMSLNIFNFLKKHMK